MATASLVQIVSTGQMDLYLNEKPELSFFKTVTKRHTAFAMEPKTYSTIGACTWGSSNSRIEVSRDADLIHKQFLRVQLPALEPATGQKIAWVNKLGFAMFKKIEIEIGYFV